MILDSYVDTCHVEFLQPHGIYRDWYIFNYGAEIEVSEKYLVASAAEPLKLHNTLTKGNVYIAVSETSSSTSVAIPETQWFIDDKSEKTLVYQKTPGLKLSICSPTRLELRLLKMKEVTLAARLRCVGNFSF